MNIIEWRDALLESKISYKAKLVGLTLSQFYRHDGSTFPAIRTLVELTSLTQNPVQDGLKEIEKAGFISRKQERLKGNRFVSNIYVFLGVTKDKHVSLNDTSNDTSFDTSHDMSPHDTEVEEVVYKKDIDKSISQKPSILQIEPATETEWIKLAMQERSIPENIARDWMVEFKNYLLKIGKRL